MKKTTNLKPTVGNLKKYLNTLDDNTELIFCIMDYYSTPNQVKYANILPIDFNSGIWTGYSHNKDLNNVFITVWLEDENDKHPKITFRK